MSELLLVTGATGTAGSAIVMKAAQEGTRPVRALVRGNTDLKPFVEAGVEVVNGDVTDPASLDRAMAGVSHVVHAAGQLSGTYRTATDQQMWDVNLDGALNVMDAATRAGVERTVLLDSIGAFDFAFTLTERSPVSLIRPIDSAYIHAKRAAFYNVQYRASLGQPFIAVSPGTIFGPGVFPDRILDPTTFTKMIHRALVGELEEFVEFVLPWVFVDDLAAVSLRALDRGEPGHRYLAIGDNNNVASIPKVCNMAAEIAGVEHRVRAIDPTAPGSDIGTMKQFADRVVASPLVDCSETTKALGITPTPLADGVRATVDWFRSEGLI